jgi:hypothetical protein
MGGLVLCAGIWRSENFGGSVVLRAVCGLGGLAGPLAFPGCV